MNSTTRRWLMRGLKILLAGLILFFIARQFHHDLSGPDDEHPDRPSWSAFELRPAWLAASGVLYLLGIFPAAWFWRHLHGLFGYPLPLYAAVRAHYIGQLGKYVPGKALAIAMRADLIHPFGVPYGVAIIVSFYEVLTGMAAGGIVAAGIYAVEPPGDLGVGLHPLALGVVLIGLCGVPLLPGVFNFLVARMTAKIQAVELYRLPPVRFRTLTLGLVTTGAGWWVQGLSWWAMLQAVLPDPPALGATVWAQCTAGIAFATVAGFASMIPGGFVVREAILTISLTALGTRPELLAAAILLRLDWIAAEALFAFCAYWIKPAPKISGPET